MSMPQIEIQLIAAIVAVACALPGVFLILRQMAMMSDAISHAILFGIVIAFFLTNDITSSLLIIAATLTGVLTVSLVELLNKTRLVREDAAMGLVFPVLFSIGVILISKFAGNVHLDIDAVLLGELAFAPFDRFIAWGIDWGPKALHVMGIILLLNIIFIRLFYKELKLTTFDAALATALGFSPGFIHYSLMTLVSLTAVGAFDAVGSILVIAMMIAPPASAYLLTHSLSRMLKLSALIGVASAIGGYWMAHFLDVSIAGSMATMAGVIFGMTFFLAPQRGIIAGARRRNQQKWDFAQTMLLVHLMHHEGLPEAARENHFASIYQHLNWNPEFAQRVIRQVERKTLIQIQNGNILLNDQGRSLAQKAMVH